MGYKPNFKRISGTQFVNSVLKRQKIADDFLVKKCFTPEMRKANIKQPGYYFDEKGNLIYSV